MSKRDQILREALKLFTEHGFRGTSTAEISKQAGVATGTLFHHFKSKEELIEVLYLSSKSELADYLKIACEDCVGCEEIIRQSWFSFVEWAVANESKYRFFKHCEASPYISEAIKEKAMPRFAFIFDSFTELVCRRDDGLSVMFLLNIYSGAMDGFIRHLMANPTAKEDKTQWESAFNLCWKILV
jgi:AcrR family transcriptional regulator